MFKKFLIAGAAVLALAACSKVPAGNVGVKAYLLGGSKGVDTEELGPGRYWIGVNEELYLFPTFTQNYTWQGAESISFQTVDGMAVTADIGISYAVDPTKVSAIYQKYRKGIDEITDIYLRNMVRDALVTEASILQVETVYGKGKEDLIKKVEARVRSQVAELGIVIERVYWVGTLTVPPNVTAAINAKIKATQEAQRREDQVQTATAQANIQIETAKGEAEAVRIKAEADANAIRIRGEALRENKDLVSLTIAEKWNGVLPQITGGVTPLLNVDSVTKKP